MRLLKSSIIYCLLFYPITYSQVINGSFVTDVNDSLYSVTIEVSLQSGSGTAGVVQIEFSFNSTSLSYPFIPQKDTDYMLHGDFDLYATQNITRPGENIIRISLLTLGTPPVPIDTSLTNIITFYFNLNGNGGASDLVWLQTDIAPAFLQGNYELGNWPNLTEQLPIWTSISLYEKMPGEYKLYQNYPNPFNPTTMIEFSLPEATLVVMKVFNVTGREVEELVNEEVSAGNHQVVFDGSNYSSGIYYYKITADNYFQVHKMILIR